MVVREIQKITDRKRKLLLEDSTSFVLYAGEVRSYHLEAGEDIPQDVLQTIRDEILVRRARLRCMNLLKSMDRTEKQLERRLVLDGYPPDVIADALSYVASYHYTDDTRYAQTYIRQMAGRKSRKQIEWDLRGRGIDPAVIRAALLEQDEENEEGEDPDLAAAQAFARKKGFDPDTATEQEAQRLLQQLLRKGFSHHTARQVLGRYT